MDIFRIYLYSQYNITQNNIVEVKVEIIKIIHDLKI